MNQELRGENKEISLLFSKTKSPCPEFMIFFRSTQWLTLKGSIRKSASQVNVPQEVVTDLQLFTGAVPCPEFMVLS